MKLIVQSWLAVAIIAMHSCAVVAQTINETFDGSSGIAWNNQSDVFIINTNQQLQLNDVVASQSYYSTSFAETSLDNREWRIWVKQSFAGSDNNQSRIYLAASGSALNYSGTGSAGVQGYFLKLGEAGSGDVIKLCRDNGSGNIVEIAAGSTSIASSFTIFIKVVRDAAGQWTVLSSPNGTSYQPECTVTDNTFTASSAFGMVCTYTVSNATKFYFDDIYFGDIIVDTAPPELFNVQALSATEVDVLFSEAVSLATAQTVSNYVISGIGNPSGAIRDNQNFSLVHLTMSTPLEQNLSYTLQVSGVQDEAGNTMTSIEQSFMWFVPSQATYRQVVFNEVLADPTPVVGLPNAEFVELFNASNSAFNLAGWKFVNTTTVKTLPDYVLPPGGFVVLCEDDFAPLFTSAIGITSFVALVNAGDSLTLLSNDNELIDVLVYSDTWFDSPEKISGGWSLEQVNPLLPCGGKSNWKESVDPLGGTPGALNSVFNPAPDNTPPQVISWSVISDNQLSVSFSESLDTTGFTIPWWNVFPFNSIAAATWNSTLDQVLLLLALPVQLGQVYELHIEGIADCSGNTIAPLIIQFVKGYLPGPGDVLINEIMADPTPVVSLPNAEWIELYNTTDLLLDITGLKLNNGYFKQQVLLQPHEYLLVHDDDNTLQFLAYNMRADMAGFPGLTNTGLLLTLEDVNDVIIDQVQYSITWYGDASKDDGGWTLERINLHDPCSDASNWSASNDPRGGTPAEINSVYSDIPDTTVPHLLYVLAQPQDAITLVFDEPIATTSGINQAWFNNIPLDPLSFSIDPTDPSRVIVLVGEMEPGQLYSFTFENMGDCWGNSTAITGVATTGQQAVAGDLIINEVLSDPFTGGSDFVEIYNRSARHISLRGWQLANTQNGAISNTKTITEEEFILFSGQYLVLTTDGTDLPRFYPFTRIDRVWRMSALPAYNVSSGTVHLLMPDGSVCESFSYREDMHFPLLNSTDGVSLERIDYNRPASDETNWHSAAESQGFATPGYVNSQALVAGITDEQVVVEPEIFSPDNDGYQDVCTISFTAGETGLTGNIYIMDSRGRQVRHLMRNQLLGHAGQISWDGLDDYRQLQPIGIYIIYFEAFAPDGKLSRIKKSCVLAHRLN